MSENTEPIAPKTPPTKREIWLPLALSLAVCGGIGVGMKLQNESLLTATPKAKTAVPTAEDIIGQGRMEEILRYVDAKYVDDVNNSVLVDKAINNLLEELDPHSVYIPANEMPSVTEDLEGEFDGIGIETLNLDDTITVVTPIANSPAAKAGIVAGDKIIAVGDSAAVGKDLRWLNARLRGKRGTQIRLSILRGTSPRPQVLTVERDKIPLHSVEGATALDDKTGYVKISRFSANTTREFTAALEFLFEKKGVKNLVIDLRGNPGGYLDKAVDILSQLFPEKDQLVVFTKGRTVHKNEYKTNGRQRYGVGKVAILIDEGSASASEIVAGAVQDWDRGVVVGRRSFGKGLVQEPYALSDGSELRLTVARYYTPLGRTLQKPYKGKSKKEYADEDKDRLARGELTNADSTAAHDSTRYFTPNGRIVYGGGGITPDVFVPIEAAARSNYYQNLKNWASEFAYRYYVLHRSEIKFTDWRSFEREFKVTDYAFREFVGYAERHGVGRDNVQMETVKEPIRRLMKARIARQLFGEEGYFGILNDNDTVVRRALEVLQQDDPLGLRRIAQKRK